MFKENSLFFYLPIALREDRNLVLLKCNSVEQNTKHSLSKISIRVTESVSYNDNRNARCASFNILIVNESTKQLHLRRMKHKVNFMSCSINLNSEFFFSETGCHTKVKELSLHDYLSLPGWRIVEFISFPRVLAIYEN